MQQYFQSIRNNPEALQHFFTKMPKGGDIHHHALGALWAEDVIAAAVEMNLWIDPQTAQLSKESKEGMCLLSDCLSTDGFTDFCIKNWSVQGFNQSKDVAPQHFFDIFPKIAPVFVGNEAFWLQKIAKKAAEEGILYVETLIECAPEWKRVSEWALSYTGSLSEEPTWVELEGMRAFLREKGFEESVKTVLQEVSAWHKAVEAIAGATIRYQLYAVRTLDPRQVMAQLLLAFEAAHRSNLIVGVNLVAPEHHPNTLRYYNWQMILCNLLRSLYKNVNLALHAGELTPALVSTEHLQNHIEKAIEPGMAIRIGHGVDLLSEQHFRSTLQAMEERDIAIEILPESNDFILGVRGQSHPFEAYYRAEVPIVVATDDPGLLRCTLAEQYYRLACDYPFLMYEDFKDFAFDSLYYSFLPSSEIERLEQQLEAQFAAFEKNIQEKG